MDNSKQRIIAIAAVGIVLLLGINAFLLIKNSKTNAANEALTQQLDESEQLKVELEKQYYEALSELEEQKGTNEELNALIDEQKAELEDQKNKISRLIRDNRQLGKAREDMKQMSANLDQYRTEIQSLKDQLAVADQNIQTLTTDNTNLTTNLAAKTEEAAELSTKTASLTSEKEALLTERTALSEKVSIASMIRTEGIAVQGFKTRSNGKVVEKKSAKNIDHLKICFNTTENRVASLGDESFYIRIINPAGETLAVEELGSGVVTDTDTGEQIRFTKAVETEYDRSTSTLCTRWQPNVPFQSGTYEVQVYNKGFISGQSKFMLK